MGFILASLLLAGAQPVVAPAGASDPDPWRFKALVYYRATAFRSLAEQALCGDGGATRREFEGLAQRLEQARARLAEVSNSHYFRPSPDDRVPPAPCSEMRTRVTMRGFADKVAELEAAAKAGVP